MSRLVPVSRGEMVRRLKKLGFEGPFQGKRHQHLIRGTTLVIIPNPHHGQDSRTQLIELLQLVITAANFTATSPEKKNLNEEYTDLPDPMRRSSQIRRYSERRQGQSIGDPSHSKRSGSIRCVSLPGISLFSAFILSLYHGADLISPGSS